MWVEGKGKGVGGMEGGVEGEIWGKRWIRVGTLIWWFTSKFG